MPRKDSIIKTKTEAYASRIINLYKYLVDKNELVMSKQIYRSGTSIGANVAESINAQSDADFISKLSIALKEANETEFWLKSLYSGNYIDEKGFLSMMNDNEEIIRILVKSIKTKKRNARKED
jgi:four helix bundle protein